ncbi:MAG: TrkA C-terminal domain-containing protein [Phycisphaerae bacterium]|nr:TrkA C-terminal domain-containing protein [Phycisphaerae bacterium]
MIAVAIVLIVLLLSLTATRIATVALTLTGLSHELARFQARSAFTGCGFTTTESEQIMSHPVRRKIIMLLMLLGNAGLVTVVSLFVIAFIGSQDKTQGLVRLATLVGGIIVIWLLSSSAPVTRAMERTILWALRKWTKVDVRDYVSLFRLSAGFSIFEMKVDPEDWVVDKTLAELNLPAEGVTVLGIMRPSGYVGVPRGETCIFADDILVLYGRTPAIDDLDTRRRGLLGERARREAVREEADRLKEQEAAEEQQTDDAGTN